MSTELVMQWLFPVVLLPALLTVPLVVAGKGLNAYTEAKNLGSATLWILSIILAWGGTAYILLVPAGSGGSWWSWYVRLIPLVVSGVPAGMLWSKRSSRKWLSVLPTCTAFFFLFLLLTVLIAVS